MAISTTATMSLRLRPVFPTTRMPYIMHSIARARSSGSAFERTEPSFCPSATRRATFRSLAFTARSTRLAISALGVTHRRGGYRDPESQAFIESWFRYLKERCVWRNEFETLDQAREVIGAYIDQYHDRPHSRLDYKTPREVRATWDDAQEALQKTAA